MERVTLQLPQRLLQDASRVAHADDVTIGHLVRVLLAKEVARRLNPKTPNVADEALVAALQALLANDMAEAESWEDLAGRLDFHGYEVRAAGGGIAIFKSSCGTRVCKGSELGFSYRSLVTRFQEPMPGHTHGALGVAFDSTCPDQVGPLDGISDQIRSILQAALRSSQTWVKFTHCLAQHRLELRPRGGALALFKLPQGRHLCQLDPLSSVAQELRNRFQAELTDLNLKADTVKRRTGSVAPFDVIEKA